SQHTIQPKFKQSKNRFGSIVIGIPTIKREKASYLLETLKSVFDAMNEVEKNEAVVVIFIPELDDQSFVQTTIENLNRAYNYELESGLLEIVVPPAEFYPNFTLLPQDRVFNDSRERVKWRTKQNYDFSYMMAYCQKRGIYYLQLEDDVVAKSGFFSTIKNFITEQKSNDWMIIEFSQLGFIGKLFKCSQLKYFVNFFLMFANNKPVDWLFDIMLDVKICNPDKPNEHCLRSKTSLKIRYKPSLFQHVGIQSSLKGKTQKLKDKDFGKSFLSIVAHQNPLAKIKTSLKTYMKHSIDSVYLGSNFFWSMSPVENDYILFQFYKPTFIRRYYIKSGNPEHPEDKLYNATFHIKTQRPIQTEKIPKNYILTSDNFYIIDTFSNQLGTIKGKIDPNVTGLISEVRIHIPTKSDTWVIISEIDLSSKDKNEKKVSKFVSSK
ncbi:alpha-1-3-mannosyl-glyco 4-beta-N-acetylglucosaminyltransferase B, partial [Brachionus plicatilis]